MQARLHFVRTLGMFYLVFQGTALFAWWALLLLFPSVRGLFNALGAPDATLFAFIVGDLTVYATGSLIAAYGLARNRAWAWTALCITAGSAIYAALYALTLPIFSGGGWLGALMMAPALIVMPTLVWLLRPARVE